MARGRKNTPTEGQLDIFDALMDIESDNRELTPGEDQPNENDERRPGVRAEVRSDEVQQDSEPGDLFSFLAPGTPERGTGSDRSNATGTQERGSADDHRPTPGQREPSSRDSVAGDRSRPVPTGGRRRGPATDELTPAPVQGPDSAQSTQEAAESSQTAAEPFRLHSSDQYAPSGAKSRYRANIDAIRTVRTLESVNRPATRAEQETLAAWSSWGAVADVFDARKDNWASERAELRDILTDEEYDAAQRTTINAHYTDPRLVTVMWDSLDQLGLTEGRVLEPGAGSGNYIGTAPEAVNMVGVELDPLTASIARHLYPQAEVRTESFAHTLVRPGEYDAAIGNVPFSDSKLPDSTWNPDRRFSMHNHFMRKALGGLHEGGVMAMLTSSYSMDTQNPAFRAEVSKEADLLGAVRLPSGTHRRTAGTEVVTDVLVLRKRLQGEDPTPATRQWVKTSTIEVEDGQGIVKSPRANDYFIAHPENVLGDYGIGGQFSNQLIVTTASLDDVPEQLRDRLDTIIGQATAQGRGYVPLTAEAQAERTDALEHATKLTAGTLTVEDGQIKQVSPTQTLRPFEVPQSRQVELKSLLGIRDAMSAVIQDQASTVADTDASIELRERARDLWESHVEKYGPVNRFTSKWVEKEQDNPLTGEKETVRVEKRTPPAVNRFAKRDPMWSLVAAAENFNEDTQEATPADILTRRTVSVHRPLLGADTPEEALTLVLDDTGRADLDQVAARLGTDPTDARAQLGTLVFDDPESDEIITRAEYLSGHVRDKLDLARAKAEDEPNAGWETNVAALEAVIPEDVPIGDIEAQVGAVWIPAADHEQFLQELTGDEHATVENHGAGYWSVKGSRAGRSGAKATAEWGTDRRPAHDLFESLVSASEIKVEDSVDDGFGNKSRVPNETETQAAKDKADAIAERFSEWVWEDHDRADRLSGAYNRQFNSLVARDYTEEGQRLTLPGLAADFTPDPHQRTAVARMVSEQAVGLFHQVGAGKTAATVIGVMELKRRGLINKPAVLVPGHMLAQFTREWQQLYPQAKLLSAGADDMKVVKGDKSARRQFVAQAAANNWDGIIMTHSAFEKLDVTDATLATYMNKNISELREAYEIMRDDPEAKFTGTVKQIENRIVKQEARLEKALDGRDVDGLTITDTGIDYIAIDEAHLFKNLNTVSSIPGASIQGSQRASDMEMKIGHLRDTYGTRVVTMATGTPIANSISEAHVMMRYLRPDLLEKTGVSAFDDWAKTFGETVARWERNAAGQMVAKERFAKFKNVPEMLGAWQQFADVKMSEDLNLDVPDIAVNSDGDRRPQIEVITRSNTLAQYMESLEARLDKLAASGGRPEKGEDNHLSVYGDGRKASLDPRLVGEDPGGEYLKVDKVGANIAEIWRANKDTIYPLESGDGTSENPGALQIVFCDLSTPNPTKWNFYDQLKSDLASKHGMDRDRIRFIHEAKNDTQKNELFRQARNGEIDVLVGSTQRMGTGANMQLRAKALHHVDCPWRPDEVTQREGRIIRRGNANEEVHVIRYATDDSFDSTAWGTIARKAAPIQQIMRGRIDVRELEDPGNMELDAKTLMGAASGNPLILEKVEIEAEVSKLQRQFRSHDRQEQATQHKLNVATNQNLFAIEALPEVKAMMDRTRIPEDFTATVNGRTYDKRTEATAALIRDVVDVAGHGRRNMYVLAHEERSDLMQLHGHDIGWSVSAGPAVNSQIVFTLDGSDLAKAKVAYPWKDLIQEPSPNVVVSLENRIKALPKLDEDLKQVQTTSSAEIETLKTKVGHPFTQTAELAELKAKLDEINTKLNLSDEQPTTVSSEQSPDVVDAQAQSVLDHVNKNRAAPGRSPAHDAGATSEAQWVRDYSPERTSGREGQERTLGNDY